MEILLTLISSFNIDTKFLIFISFHNPYKRISKSHFEYSIESISTSQRAGNSDYELYNGAPRAITNIGNMNEFGAIYVCGKPRYSDNISCDQMSLDQRNAEEYMFLVEIYLCLLIRNRSSMRPRL